MTYFDYMYELLYPLKLYNLDSGYSAEELRLIGESFDSGGEEMDEAEREAIVTSAEDWGLDFWEELFPYRPSCDTVGDRREALSALMRIDGTKFTLEAVNDTIRGSGVEAIATEDFENQCVYITFGDIIGEPDGFAEISACIDSIIPCHLELIYSFRYRTWGELDARECTWGDIDALGVDFMSFEKI